MGQYQLTVLSRTTRQTDTVDCAVANLLQNVLNIAQLGNKGKINLASIYFNKPGFTVGMPIKYMCRKTIYCEPWMK